MKTLLLLFLVLGSSYVCKAVTAIDRSDELKYNVVIEDRKKIEGLPGTLVKMTSSVSKRKYECLLPEEMDSKRKEDDDGSAQVDVPTLLKPLTGQCIYRLNGWWTYEFCFGNHIRQYHQERDLPVRPQDEFFLGRWKEGVKDENHIEGDYQFYSTRYSEGTVCDLTGQRRSTEVRFICAADKTVTSVIDVKEPYSCHYIMTVSTPLLCSHPSYRPKRETVKSIICCPEPIEGQEMTEDGMDSQEIIRDRETLDKVFKQAYSEDPPEVDNEVPAQQEIFLDLEQLVKTLNLNGLSNSELQSEIVKGIQEAIREQQEIKGDVRENTIKIEQRFDPEQLEELQRNHFQVLQREEKHPTHEESVSTNSILESESDTSNDKKNKKEL